MPRPTLELKNFAIAAGIVSLCLLAAPARAALPEESNSVECGTDDTISIAKMSWDSAGMLAHVVDKVLAAGYGCATEFMELDTVQAADGYLEGNKPDVVPEFWVTNVAATWEKIQENGNVHKAGDAFTGGAKQGWWIPDYVAEQYPEVKSIADLKANAKIFAGKLDAERGQLYGCAPGWACEIVNRNLFKALGLGKTFELVTPHSGDHLKGLIESKFELQEPFVTFYWEPSDVIGKYNLVRLEMPEYDADKFKCLTQEECRNPRVTAWADSEVVVAVTAEFKEKAPNLVAVLSKIQVPNSVVNRVLAWGTDNKASTEEVANYFLKQYEDVWAGWLPQKVASKVWRAARRPVSG